jgi:Rho GDP-dissociation inhibitor
MTAKFKVQHEVLSGLQYVQIVKRKGIRVSKDQEMIVSILVLIVLDARNLY